jgi:RNA polymerase sigma-70 factor (ECF subfamily)
MPPLHPEPLSDEELATRVARGDAAALAELYVRHGGVICEAAARVLRDRVEAEDVVQDVFIAAFSRAHLYTPEIGSAAAWLCALGEELSIARTRRRRARHALPRKLARRGLFGAPPDADALDREARLWTALSAALDALSHEHRRALEAVFFHGLDCVEIAAHERVPVAVVESRVAHALDALRAAFEFVHSVSSGRSSSGTHAASRFARPASHSPRSRQ